MQWREKKEEKAVRTEERDKEKGERKRGERRKMRKRN